MPIAREKIDPEAEKVVRRLRRYGHTAYLVGGCVRDLLVGRSPKDWDVATSATPAEIKDLFRNCRIIGRRFRLAHIFFGQKIIETSTFRTNPRDGMPIDEEEELLIRRDNVFGTAEEDARRRDFTINGLFYDIEAGEVIDYVGGLADLEARLVRTIGDPEIRFREDPVRILRAIKFAARLGFEVEPQTYAAILAHRSEIPKCAPPRVLEEIYRLLRGGAARRSMELLLETGVAATLAPELAWMFGGNEAIPRAAESTPPAPEASPPPARLHPPHLDEQSGAACRAVAWQVLDELDQFIRTKSNDGWQPTNATLIAALVEPFLPEEPGGSEGEGPPRDHFARIEDTLRPVVTRLRASRRDAERARQILLAQRRLRPSKRRKSKPMALVRRDYFLEALVVYELLSRATHAPGDEAETEIARWYGLWRKNAGVADGEGGSRGGPPGEDAENRRRRRRRRGGRRRRRGPTGEIADLPLGDAGEARPALPGEGSKTP
jgi:poly(A) polymerase